jgi:very-short-patch-repair endonuclease
MTPAERKPRFNPSDIREIQRRQLGLITATQATAAGMSASAMSRRVTSGVWNRPLPRVYRDGMAAHTPEQAALAAQLWAGPSATLSFAAAGSLWRLDGVDARKPELWVPDDQAPTSELVIVHRGSVDPNDVRMMGLIRLTSPARTLIDLAGVLDDEDLNAVVEDAIHRGLTTAPAIARRLETIGSNGRAGSARLRAILDDRGGQRAAAFRLEVKIWRVLRAKGLTPVRQFPVRCRDTTYWLDCAFPQWRVAVEGFGDKFHRGARKRKRELRRFADLASVNWRVVPVTWDEITEAPDDVVARVLTTLAA